MPQLKLKDQDTTVHVPGLGLFEPGKATEVSDEQIKEYEKQTRTVVKRKVIKGEDGAPDEVEVTVEEVKVKVSDLFEVTKDPVEKKDTGAKKSDNGGEQ